MAKREVKLIGGFKHYRVRCGICNELVWTQASKINYKCNTCVEYKFAGSQLGTTRGDLEVARSEKAYNG